MPEGPPTWEFDRDRLAGTRFATVRTHAELGSTNAELAGEARAGASEGLVIVADHQTAGRGRLGRTWSAEPGTALLVSVLLRPRMASEQLPVVLMAAGLAAADGVEAAAGFRPRLKWPNDLVVGDIDGARKLAGLLTESTTDEARAVILGLGINVTAGAYPAGLAGAATSCEEAAGRPVDRAVLLVEFLVALERRYSVALAAGGSAATTDAYRADSATLGRRVRVELPRATVEGEAVDVTGEGALVVVDAAGLHHEVHAGDVVHLRT